MTHKLAPPITVFCGAPGTSVLIGNAIRYPNRVARDGLLEPVTLIKKRLQPEPPVGSVRMMYGSPILHTDRGWVLTRQGWSENLYTWARLLATKRPITEYTA